MDEAFEAGRRAWPSVELEPSAFAEYVNARELGAEGLAARAADLYIVCACLNGVEGAAEAFGARYLAPLRAYLGTLASGRDDDFVKGVRLIYSKLLQVLQKMGVVEVDSLHQPFDPTRHMAIGQIETDETASGNVARVITKGYIFNGSVIRPAHVIVAK